MKPKYITKLIKRYYVVCLNQKGQEETYSINQEIYRRTDQAVLKYISRYTDCKPIRIVKRFFDELPYIMDESEFIKNAKIGRLYVKHTGKQEIWPPLSDGSNINRDIFKVDKKEPSKIVYHTPKKLLPPKGKKGFGLDD